MELIFATQNQNKVNEVQQVMPDWIKVKSLLDIGCTEDIPETADTLEGNALQKAKYVAQKYKVNCFADDTGLEVLALNGEPGVRSARYAGEQKDANANIKRLLDKLNNTTNRNAQFRTAIALIINGQTLLFEGVVTGRIRKEKSGNKGFGYDPVFEPENKEVTFAEMEMESKNALSHRARAIQKMLVFLNEQKNRI
jgi:XTP/dITP diphosphohydrolase